MMTPMIESRKISSDVNHYFHPCNKIRKKGKERFKKNKTKNKTTKKQKQNESRSFTKE